MVSAENVAKPASETTISYAQLAVDNCVHGFCGRQTADRRDFQRLRASLPEHAIEVFINNDLGATGATGCGTSARTIHVTSSCA
jgi:hypothetical protein